MHFVYVPDNLVLHPETFLSVSEFQNGSRWVPLNVKEGWFETEDLKPDQKLHKNQICVEDQYAGLYQMVQILQIYANMSSASASVASNIKYLHNCFSNNCCKTCSWANKDTNMLDIGYNKNIGYIGIAFLCYPCHRTL